MTHQALTNSANRLIGLDFARFLAFAGMVVVNFKIVMDVQTDSSNLYQLASVLEGRAAGAFVLLTGIGLGLAHRKPASEHHLLIILKRALFLLVVGSLNMLIFQADILHFYAFYFVIGSFFIGLHWLKLLGLTSIVVVAAFLMQVFLDYDAGWDWDNFFYQDLWTAQAYFRHILFNGWHPIFPWIGFLFLGLAFAQLPLADRNVQYLFILIGTVVLLLTTFISEHFISLTAQSNEPWYFLFETKPIPPNPFYFLSSTASACILIGLSLMVSPWFIKSGLFNTLLLAGRQTLTLYLVHIVLAMTILEILGWTHNMPVSLVWLSSAGFIFFCLFYVWIWSKHFKRGPMESVMRKLAG